MGSGFRDAAQVARQRKLGLFHAVSMADGRQGLAASLVIFWAFLGILASAAGCATGRLARVVNLAHFPPHHLPEDLRGLTKSQLTSLCFLFSDHQRDRGAGQFCELLDCTADAGVDQLQQPDLNRKVLAL